MESGDRPRLFGSCRSPGGPVSQSSALLLLSSLKQNLNALDAVYSFRSASIGSVPAARRAGIQAAISVAAARVAETPVRTVRSHELTPKRRLLSKRPMKKDAGMPKTRPQKTR